MKNILILSFLIIASIHTSNGQDHFLVEMEVRTPTEQDMVKSFEGFPSIPLQANDILDRQVDLMSMKGKTVIMFFWELDNQKSIDQIDALNLIQSRYRDHVSVISFANDQKAPLLEYFKSRPIDFPIVPNSKTLSDGPYGSELGCPKLFIIDAFGVIKWVFPESSFSNPSFDTVKVLETLVVQLNK